MGKFDFNGDSTKEDGLFLQQKRLAKKLRFQRNPETWRAKTQSSAPLIKKTVIKFLHRAKLAIFRDLVMHCNLFYDENYSCTESFFADSRILKPCNSNVCTLRRMRD